MSNTQHTPGPWRFCSATGGVFSGEKFVASVYGDDPDCKPDEKLKANVCLIAAAPELLKALKECRNGIEGGQRINPYDSLGAGYEQTFGIAFLKYLNDIISKAEKA